MFVFTSWLRTLISAPTRFRTRLAARRVWATGLTSASAGMVPADYMDSGSERGDVPGWVLVTLMTVGLVIAIWAVAGPALVDLFNTAIDRITSFAG